ncbi:MAG: PQQ-binding-like beta-propeller repeat protein [Thermoanaerobaculia bacterium]|nr:PQQ-binding-like beta-propeller repeat protein [Thermoanaerobaculia bacterium]
MAALGAAAAADWPQWRGPGGLGVAPEGMPLPAEWSPESGHLRWATALPGSGHSSPIAAGGRIFLTTAYEGSRAPLLARLLAVGGVVLGLWLAVGVVRSWRRGDRVALRLLTLLFLTAAAAIALAPDLFYPGDRPGRVWRATAAVALVGLAAAVGWLPPRSRLRTAGIALVAGAGAWVAWQLPGSQIGPPSIEKRVVAALPAIVAVALFLRAHARADRAGQTGRSGAWHALPLVLLALVVFVPPNFLRGQLRAVVAVDLASGELLWQRAAFAAPPEQKYARASYANPTPATDGERVFAYFGAGLAAFDRGGGALWTRRFPDYARYSRYGAASSPVVAGDAVIVVQESEAYQGGPPGWIQAFDAGSGETLWKISPEDARDSYGTPLVVEVGGRSLLLTASWEFLAAYDLADGKRLWRVGYPMMQMVASMARRDDLVAVSGGAHGDRKLLVLRLAGDPTRPPQVLWESTSAVARVPSPLFAGGLLFTLTDGGVLTAYGETDGRRVWRRRLEGDYFASLLAGDGKLYAVNTEGAVSVVAVGPSAELLAVNRLDEPVHATPAVAGGCLLIRTAERLYCFAADGPPSPAEGG